MVKSKLRGCLLGLIVVGAAAACYVFYTSEFVGGQTTESPNGKYRAHIRGPMGESNDPWLELCVDEIATSSEIYSVRIDFPTGTPIPSAREAPSIIQWADDSESLRLNLHEGKPLLHVHLPQ